MIRTVDLAVTVRAALGRDEGTGRVVDQRAHVGLRGVTGLAKLRCAAYQQRVVYAAVRVVAVRAVLCYGLVLPKHRAPRLRMTFVTIVVYGLGRERRLAHAAVRAVAGRAAHETTGPYPGKRVMTAFVHRGALLQVAPAAGINLSLGVAHWVMRCVHLVAIGTGNALHVVCTVIPQAL